MWHFIAPPDFTPREEAILRGIVEAIQRSRQERGTAKDLYTNTNIDKLKLHTKKESGCRHE